MQFKTHSMIWSLLSFLTLSQVIAAEADNFSRRGQKSTDEANTVNVKANEFLASGVALTNAQGSCDDSKLSEQRLYTNLRKYFANHKSGELSQFILYQNETIKNVIPLKESVYKEWTPINGFLLGGKKAASSPLALAPLIQIGDVVVGTDKFEHMFGMGFNYFSKYYLKGKSLTKIFKFAVLLEKTTLGGNVFATGVFSYGDLSANFNGMRFWNHVLQKKDDILGSEYNVGPFVECKNNKLAVVKAIDFRNYMDSSMDESINCSKFASKAGLRKFTNSLERLGAMKCPMDSNTNLELQNKYSIPIKGDHRTISDWIINKGSNEQVSYFNEF